MVLYAKFYIKHRNSIFSSVTKRGKERDNARENVNICLYGKERNRVERMFKLNNQSRIFLL